MGRITKEVLESLYNVIKTNKVKENIVLYNLDSLSQEQLNIIINNGDISILTDPYLLDNISEYGIENVRREKFKNNKDACNEYEKYGKIDTASSKRNDFDEDLYDNRIRKL